MPPPQPLTGEAVDQVLVKLDEAADRVVEFGDSMVKVRRAEFDLLAQIEVIRDMMERSFRSTTDHGALKETFGGDCERIAHVRAILENVELSDMNKGDQRWNTCLSMVQTVEKVLSDMGLSRELRKAQRRFNERVKKRQSTRKSIKASQILKAIDPEILAKSAAAAAQSGDQSLKDKKDVGSDDSGDEAAALANSQEFAALNKVINEMKALEFDASKKEKEAGATFGNFNRAVRDAVKSSPQSLDAAEPKDKVLKFLQSYMESAPKMSARVVSVFKLLFELESWANVADDDPNLEGLLRETAPEAFMRRSTLGAKARGALGALLVNVIAAHGLARREDADPRVKVSVGDQERETETEFDTLSPRYNEGIWVMDVFSEDALLELEVLDDAGSWGHIEIPVNTAPGNLGQKKIHSLEHGDGGTLEIDVAFTKADEASSVTATSANDAPVKRVSRAWALDKNATQIPTKRKAPKPKT